MPDTQFDVQLEVALCRLGASQSLARELSQLLPVVRRSAAGVAQGLEVDGALASGIPSGGTTGQVLTKASAADQDATWQTPSGAGLGDFSSNTATSVDSEIMLFSGTGGKTGKRATTTGMLKAASGVLAAAVAGTDYLAPAAIGVTVQAYDAGLLSIAGLTTAADTGIYTTGSDSYSTYSLTAGGRALAAVAGTSGTFPYFSASNTVTLGTTTAAGRALMAGADAAAQMTSLGFSANAQSLVTAANYAAMKTLLSLNNVENTALSTWAGSANLTTLGTIGTGTWNATAIGVSKGGTGQTGLGTALQVLRTNAAANGTEWATISGGGASVLDDLTDVVITSPTNGQVLKYNGTNWVNDTDATGGGGSVTISGTPADNRIAVWTGSSAIEGDTALTFDTTTDTLAVGASGKFAFGAVTILDDSAGTTTLSNIDALDATTETTIEAAIDTLANLTSIQGQTFTLTGAFVRSGAHSLTITTTGTTSVTFPTSGTLLASGGALGTPSSGTLSSCTGLPVSTGISGLGSNVATFLATPSSANLRAALTDEEGDGALLFANSPATLSTGTNLVRSTHGNRFLICDTSATHTVEDDTTGGWQNGDTLFGVNTSGGNVTLQGDGTATVTAEIGATLTVPAGRPWVLQRTAANTWRGGATTTLSVAGGGTGATTLTAGGLLVGNGTSAISAISGYAAEAAVASATTTDIGAAASLNVSITGTTTITGLGTVAAGTHRYCRFTGALTLTHNATSLILPGGANITTAAGDRMLAESLGSGNWVVLFYQKADGTAIAGGAGGGDASTNTATSVDSEVALFSGTGGKTLKRATGSGVALLTSGVLSTFSLGTNVQTFLTTPSSANLAAAVTDETGSGALVFATSPTLVTPVLGTPTSGNLSNCTADGTNSVGFKNVPQNSQSAAYTTVLSDAGKHIYHPSGDANARTFTIDSNANVAYPIGTSITFVNETSQVVTIAITSDTLVLAGTGSTGSRSLAQYGVATALKVGTTRWIINGTGLT